MPEDSRLADNRPSPDALLDRAERETRGRLRIFLGAAPGVGKTYEMLMSGRARMADGLDVVIGVVETHGREETEALVEGFEVVPRRHVDYKGRQLEEMDLDAILARRPELVLVDELAHTNAPGSRHPKRYLDVQEILAQGIDVYSTLNIQHVESLNDVVAQITRVRVRETVPDSIIDRADDIEIIDITPEDLIKRLGEGKVYVPATAKRAIENYFSPGNLTALRELALRRTAQRVDEQLLTHMQAHAIPGPWAAGERVLVCIDEHPRGPSLVRYARRQAERLRAPWAALYVETSRAAGLSEADRDRLAATLRLAEQLGADVVTLPGQNVAEDIVRYAEANNVTHIITGKPHQPRWRDYFEGSVAHDLIREAGKISVHVVSGEEHDAGPQSRGIVLAQAARFDIWPYLLATVFVAVALGFGMLLARVLDVRNIALVFLMAVLTSAVTAGLWPAIFASVVSALAFNFFFLEPLYTLTISDPESVVALVFFFCVAIIASNLTVRVQRQAVAARQRARTTEDLYLFSKKLAGTGTLDDVLWATAFQIASMLKLRVVLLLPENGSIAVRAGYPPDDTLAEADIAAARWAWEHNRAAGRGADTLPGAKRLYIPLKTGRTAVGVVGLDNDKEGPLLTPEQQRLLDALADQAAVAIERIQLVADVDRAKLAAEADRLRSALLDLDFARPEDAARGHHGRGGHAEGIFAGAAGERPRRTALDHDRRIGAAEPLHRQSARHDQDRVRRDGTQLRAPLCRRHSGLCLATGQENHRRAYGRHAIFPPTCRCSGSIPSSSSRCFSTCSTTRPNMPRRAPTSASGRGRTMAPCCCRSWTRGRASLRKIWSASSTPSTACAKATMSLPAQGSACRSAGASSRRWEEPSRRLTGPIVPARSSRSGCRCHPKFLVWKS